MHWASLDTCTGVRWNVRVRSLDHMNTWPALASGRSALRLFTAWVMLDNQGWDQYRNTVSHLPENHSVCFSVMTRLLSCPCRDHLMCFRGLVESCCCHVWWYFWFFSCCKSLRACQLTKLFLGLGRGCKPKCLVFQCMCIFTCMSYSFSYAFLDDRPFGHICF